MNHLLLPRTFLGILIECVEYLVRKRYVKSVLSIPFYFWLMCYFQRCLPKRKDWGLAVLFLRKVTCTPKTRGRMSFMSFNNNKHSS